MAKNPLTCGYESSLPSASPKPLNSGAATDRGGVAKATSSPFGMTSTSLPSASPKTKNG